MNKYIKSDIVRYYGKYKLKFLVLGYIKNPTIRFQVAFRLCNANGLSKILGYTLWLCNKSKRKIQIPRKTQIGYGLYIGHGGPLVINSTTQIGDNCNLSQFTSIGSNHQNAAKLVITHI